MTEEIRQRLWDRIRDHLPDVVKTPLKAPDIKSGLWKVVELAFEIGKHEADLKICALEMKLENEQKLITSLEDIIKTTAHLRGQS